MKVKLKPLLVKRKANDMSDSLLNVKKNRIMSKIRVHRKIFKTVAPTQHDIQELNARSYQFMGMTTKRKVAFFDSLGGRLVYTYAGKNHPARPFTPWIRKLAAKLKECYPNADFNCCNVNVYPLGTNGSLTRHQDDETCHASNTIWSCSFGASVNMLLYEAKKGKFVERKQLHDCDLAIFDRMVWHSIGSSKEVKNERCRVNVTFRKFKIQNM